MGEQEARRVIDQWRLMKDLDRHALARENQHWEVHPDFRPARERALGLMNESERATWDKLRGQLRVPGHEEVPDREMRDYLRHAYDGAERAILGELMKDRLLADREARKIKANYHGELSGAWLSTQEGIRRREERERRRHRRL